MLVEEKKRLTLIEYLYQENPESRNGKLFFDRERGRNYRIEEVYGCLLSSTLVLAEYEDGKSRFLDFAEHKFDLEVVAETT